MKSPKWIRELFCLPGFVARHRLLKNNIPGARVVYDKFHIMRHLNDALDKVRRHEYHRLKGRDRSFIKGQRYTLLSHQDNLTLECRRALRKLFKANKRLNVPPEGVLRAVVGLPDRGMGTSILRPLEGSTPLAAARTLREVRRHD